MSAAPSSLYDVLGLPASATGRDIKTAYRRLARVCHPDVIAATGNRQGASEDAFIRIHAAYATLSDPDKRVDYDRRMMLVAPGGQRWSATTGRPDSPSFSSYRRRSWETDQCW